MPGHTWDQILTHITYPPLMQSHKDPTFQSSREKPSSVSLLFIARSSPTSIDQLLHSVHKVERQLKHTFNTVRWNPFPIDFWFSHEHRLRSKRATVLANSSIVAGYLETALQRASVMYREKAYLHWYEKYSCGCEVFEEAFEDMKRTIDSYSALH